MGQGELAGGAGSGETPQDAGLRGVIQGFRERLIRLDTMGWPLRLAVGAAVVMVVLLATSIALRNVIHQPLLDETTGREVVHVPLATVVVALASLALAWAFVLTGALHAHWIARLVGLGVFTGAMVEASVVVAGEARATDPFALGQFAVIAVMWLWAGSITLAQRRGHVRTQAERAPRYRMPAITFALALASVAGIFAASVLYRTQVLHTVPFVAALVRDHLFVVSALAAAAIFLTGSDLAETAQTAAGRAASLAARFWSPWLALVLAGCVAGGIGAHILLDRMAAGGVPAVAHEALDAGLGVAAFGVVALLARVGGVGVRARGSLAVPVAAMALAAVVLFGGIGAVVLVGDTLAPPASTTPSVTFAVYRHTSRPPAFSVAYPTTWTTQVIQEGEPGKATVVLLQDLRYSTAGSFEVWNVPLPAGTGELDADVVLNGVFGQFTHDGQPDYRFSPAPADGPWEVRHVVFQNQAGGLSLDGLVWIQRQGDAYWILSGLTIDSISHDTPIFRQMAASWRPDLSAEAPVAPADAHTVFVQRAGTVESFAVPLALALAAGLPLLLIGRRRRSAALSIGGLFLAVAGLVNGLVHLRDVLALAGVTTPYVPALHDTSIQLAAALVTLGLLPALIARQRRGRAMLRPLVALLVVNLALEAVGLYYTVSASSDATASAPTRWTALALVGLFLWDLLTSGEQVTNRTSRAFPRWTRVLLYLGYTLLTTSYVAYFAVETFVADGTPTGHASDVDATAHFGLLALGMPLIITLAVVGWARLRDERMPVPADASSTPEEARIPSEIGVR